MPGRQKRDKIPKLAFTYFKVRWLSYDPTTLYPSQHLKYDLRRAGDRVAVLGDFI